MFQTLFRYPRVSSRHANGPLAQERRTFLSHLQTQGVPRSTLLRYASQLLLVAGLLPRKGSDQITRSEIARCAEGWAQRQQRRGRARTVHWAAQRFDQAACAWYSFLGWLKDTSQPQPAYHYSVICHLRPARRRFSLADVIEQRWAGDNRTAGNSWSHDHGCGRGDCAATAGRAASGWTFRLGSRSVCALAVAGWQWAMEGPLGAGDLKRVGAPRVD
jgi:hypothetical protein